MIIAARKMYRGSLSSKITRWDPQGRLAPGGSYLAEYPKITKIIKKSEKSVSLKTAPALLKNPRDPVLSVAPKIQ